MPACKIESCTGQILGIESPWFVERVELKLEGGEVHVWLQHEETASWPCPECGAACKLHDHQAERRWRHLDTCQYQTILHARSPRCEGSEHGARVVQLPWAEPSSRFTHCSGRWRSSGSSTHHRARWRSSWG